MAFWFFSLRSERAVRLLVPRSTENEASRRTLVASLPFLGGMNLAFAVLSAASIVASLRTGEGASFSVYLASAVGHTTQLAHNVPHALRGGRAGGAPWDVLRGAMSFIFVMDGLCAAMNAVALSIG